MNKFRLYFILALLAVSMVFILYPYVVRTTGVIVASVSETNCGDLSQGDIITQIGGTVIRNLQEFNEIVSKTKKGNYYPMVVNKGPGGCTAIEDGDFGVEVTDIGTSGLRFDKTIGGGVRLTLTPAESLSESEIQKSNEIIQKRMNILEMSDGLSEISNGKIVITSSQNSNLGLLARKGRLEATIVQTLEVRNNKTDVKIGDSRYEIDFLGDKIGSNGSQISIGGDFYLENIRVTFVNSTNTSIVLDSLIFDSENVVRPLSDYSIISSEPSIGLYKFTYPIELDSESGERFKEITEGLSTFYVDTIPVLNGLLFFYVDGKEISNLRIPVEMVGEEVKTLSIIGFGKTVNDAVSKGNLIEISVAGELPSEFKIENIGTFEPQNSWLIFSAPATILFVLALSLAMSKAFRSKKIALAMFCIVGIEAIFIFGIFAIVQQFTSWVIDSYALIGACIFLIVSPIDMILLAKGRSRKIMKRVSILLVLIGFGTLFTPLRGIGISILIGMVLNRLLTREFFKSFI